MKTARYGILAWCSMLLCFALVGFFFHDRLYEELTVNYRHHARMLGLLLIFAAFGVLGYAVYPQTQAGVLKPELRRKRIFKRLSCFFPLAAAGILLYENQEISF